MCPLNKIRYSTRKLAKQEARKKTKLHKLKLSAYKCEECNGFHLTSMGMKRKITVRKNKGNPND